MSNQELDILEELIRQNKEGKFIDRDSLEPRFALPWIEIKSYLYHLKKEGFVTLLCADDDILRVDVNASAFARLQDLKEKPNVPSQSVSINQNYGSLAMGDNRGANVTTNNLVKELKRSVGDDLRNLLLQIDKHNLDEQEAAQLRELLRQIAERLDSSDTAPIFLLEQLSAKIQKHAWIASPIAATIINLLQKFW